MLLKSRNERSNENEIKYRKKENDDEMERKNTISPGQKYIEKKDKA